MSKNKTKKPIAKRKVKKRASKTAATSRNTELYETILRSKTICRSAINNYFGRGNRPGLPYSPTKVRYGHDGPASNTPKKQPLVLALTIRIGDNSTPIYATQKDASIRYELEMKTKENKKEGSETTVQERLLKSNEARKITAEDEKYQNKEVLLQELKYRFPAPKTNPLISTAKISKLTPAKKKNLHTDKPKQFFWNCSATDAVKLFKNELQTKICPELIDDLALYEY